MLCYQLLYEDMGGLGHSLAPSGGGTGVSYRRSVSVWAELSKEEVEGVEEEVEVEVEIE